MSTAHYLRGQAVHCLSLARACFDLGTAQQLRLMAGDLMNKAQELESASFPQHLMATSARPRTGNAGDMDRN